MRSWDTNPWSNFCDPQWELICRNKWHTDLRNIHNTGNSCRETLPYASMALKLPQYFHLLMEKPLGRYFKVRFPYYQAAQCNQKTTIPVPLRSQVRSDKAKKGWASTLITATTSVHLPKPITTDLTNKVRFCFGRRQLNFLLYGPDQH